MRVLFISNIGGHEISSFSKSSIQASKYNNYDFYLAANWNSMPIHKQILEEKKYGIKIHNVEIFRSPFDLRNIKAYIQLRRIIKTERIDVIHCNTPIGGILGRILSKHTALDIVLYMVHGFHFYQGGSRLKNLIFKSIEKLLAKNTDALITINRDDYLAAKPFKFRDSGKAYYLPGVGIDINEIRDIQNSSKNDFDIVKVDGVTNLISVGELNKNKNNILVLKSLTRLDKRLFHYYIVGEGNQEQVLRKFVNNNGLSGNVTFLGYRTDAKHLLSQSDVFLLPSHREGLSRSLMEAMALGKACLVSDIRGNRDLIKNSNGGFLHNLNDSVELSNYVKYMIENPHVRASMGKYNEEAIKGFDFNVVSRKISQIYKEVFEENKD